MNKYRQRQARENLESEGPNLNLRPPNLIKSKSSKNVRFAQHYRGLTRNFAMLRKISLHTRKIFQMNPIVVPLSNLAKTLDDFSIQYKIDQVGKSLNGSVVEKHPATGLPCSVTNLAEFDRNVNHFYTMFLVCPGDSKGHRCDVNPDTSVRSHVVVTVEFCYRYYSRS